MRFEKVSYPQFEADILNTNTNMLNRWGCKNVNTIKKAWEELRLPERGTSGSAGYDFFAPYTFELFPTKTILVPTGIRVILDDDKFLAVYPRSGQGFKYKVQLYNTVAIIDSDYSQSENEGHIMIKMYNDSPDIDDKHILTVMQNKAFCQGIIQQYFTTEDDKAVTQRNGGFGSTG